MTQKSVATFIDYENIRRGLWRHFQKRIPQDISVEAVLNAFSSLADEIGTFYEGYVYGDWTLRQQDAREVEKIQKFRIRMALRSDSKKDRTDPVMNFALDDFFREKTTINHIIIGAGDSDYCEVVRRGNRVPKNIYICAISLQTAPELISIAKAFYPVEQRLGLKPIDPNELAEAMAKLDPEQIKKWTPLVHQLSVAESRLPYVVRSHFIKQYLPPGLGYGDTFEQVLVTLITAESLGLIEVDRIPNPEDQRPVKTIRLKKETGMVTAILGSRQK